MARPSAPGYSLCSAMPIRSHSSRSLAGMHARASRMLSRVVLGTVVWWADWQMQRGRAAGGTRRRAGSDSARRALDQRLTRAPGQHLKGAGVADLQAVAVPQVDEAMRQAGGMPRLQRESRSTYQTGHHGEGTCQACQVSRIVFAAPGGPGLGEYLGLQQRDATAPGDGVEHAGALHAPTFAGWPADATRAAIQASIAASCQTTCRIE